MGTVITVTSGKGGTGKTTVTGGVASCLARLGKSVLCIDMDIGLRNLDISLGLSDRALMDFADVALGNCPLGRAAVSHPDLPGLSLLTAPMRLSPRLTYDRVRALLNTARLRYDYILIDSPAGLGPGFQLGVVGLDARKDVGHIVLSSRTRQRECAEQKNHLSHRFSFLRFIIQ